MKFSTETLSDVFVVTLTGSLEGGPDTFEIKDAVAKAVEDGATKVLIDMGKASFVNSTGIGVLVAVYSNLQKAGHAFKVCNVSDRARRAFVVTGVWSLFEVHDSRDEALAAF